MVDIHTLNTVYRIERRSPILAEVEDKNIYIRLEYANIECPFKVKSDEGDE